MIRFRNGVSERDKATFIAAHGARKKKDLAGASAVERLEVSLSRDISTVAFQILSDPLVELAEPNFLIAKDDATPNDSEFGRQWALRNTGQNGGQPGSDVNASGAWTITTGARSTVIAVIDSGIDFTHPDLANNYWTNPLPGPQSDLRGWDFIEDSPEIKDEHGHGTAVAGIIAAQGNNSFGISGVMWRASLMSLRVLDNTGTGDVAAAIEAIDYAAAHGAHVINLSWGTSGESFALKDAIERANRRGVVVICSAGNGGRDLATGPYYPASFRLPNLITVAASDDRDRLASWSNWGAQSVTVSAPGLDVLTTQRGGGYGNVNGTSAAAPIVSGIAGLLKSVRPGVSPHVIMRAISEGARATASLSGKVASGGVADAEAALSKVRGSANQSPTFTIPTGGNGANGNFTGAPPPTNPGPLGPSLPNITQIRNENPQPPKAKAPIESNLACADCDPLGGGGGGNYYPSTDPNFSTARDQSFNETGQAGVDLGSQNFNWSVPLLSLPGRAGFDVDLSLFYNSLVWTRDGSYMKFNADLGSPAPGFRLSLPVLQQRFLNSQTGLYAYMLIMPTGARVELRQVGTSNVYESEDSSYTQLDVSNPNAPVLRTTDGRQFSFVPVAINNEYRCTQIRDRNGNYISATYNSTNGHLLTLTDTLGPDRMISFAYDANNNLQAIRQTWNGSVHDWATFNYGQVFIEPAFGDNLLINGPNNTYTTVLTQVNLHDGTYFTFQYNAAFAQVNRINRYAPDGHLLSYTSYTVSSASGQTECPRVTERREWAERWNSGNEAVTSYSVAGDRSWTARTEPDGTIYKEFFATSGWQTGLTTSTEIWSGGFKKKWTTTSWTQDDTGLSYQKNPRVTETNIYDAEGNRRRLVIDYGQYAQWGLPYWVKEYAADGVTEIRHTFTDYNLSQAYVDRRIIGLVSQVHVTNTTSYETKLTYEYDDPARLQATPATATQHDSSFGTSFTARGNVTSVSRWDVTDINNAAKKLTNYANYNTTGGAISTIDPANHQRSIAYGDAFSDNLNRNTFAYPTTITDGDGFQTLLKYRIEFGGISWVQTPSPNAGHAAPTKDLSYDSAARLLQITSSVNSAHIRRVYSNNGAVVATFTTVVNGLGEGFSAEFLDGVGRVRASISDHPASAGAYSGQDFIYDSMGRLTQRSNPTEMTDTWTPTGDDSAWIYTVQAYDWNGRPTLTTLPDTSTREVTYGGCGCAGSAETTFRDERGRRRKLTTDSLGRLKEVKELNWDQSVYATTTYAWNARDQLTQINQAGQTRTFTYDGHARLVTRTTPEQGATNYTYLADDALHTIADARGATTTFAYNNRHLVTGITYGVPSGIAATPNVTFAFDAAGNRTSMTDGLGSVSYAYDQLSRLTSETRTFTGVGSFTLGYAYNLGDQVTSITNQWGMQVGYNFDRIGRPTSVSGSNYGGVSTYVSSMSYRTCGLKQMSYGNGRTLSLQYDNRLRPTQWNIPGVMGWNYAYNYFNERSNRVMYAQNINDGTLDRSYDYDHVGRLVASHSGVEARAHMGLVQNWTPDGPYAQRYYYDELGNITSREGWGGDNPSFTTVSYTNNKRNGLTYDQAGNLTNDGGLIYTYDATGQQATASYSGYLLEQHYDGNGLRVKKSETGVITYYLRSSKLDGQVVAEISTGGALQRGYVYLGGQLLAVQQQGAVSWIHQDPIAKSKRVTNSSGNVVSTIELDPWGGNTNRSNTDALQPRKFTTYERDGNAADEAMFRRYNRWWSRFDQPDPYDGSYNWTNPQTFNRFVYVHNDPVNFVDPFGLDEEPPPGPLDTIVTNIWGSRSSAFTGAFGGGDTGITIVDPLGGEGGQVGGGVSDPTRPAGTTTPTFVQDPDGVGPEACEKYIKGGRPDLAFICRNAGNNKRANKMRKCLLDYFVIPADGRRGGYVDTEGSRVWGRLFGPFVGPGVHEKCFETALLN